MEALWTNPTVSTFPLDSLEISEARLTSAKIPCLHTRRLVRSIPIIDRPNLFGRCLIFCSEFKLKIEELVELSPVIPVVTIDQSNHAVALCRALLAGGIRVVEITLRTSHAIAAIEKIADQLPDMIIGAGTVLNEHHVKQVCDAGCNFIVSPGVTASLRDAIKDYDVPFLPGSMTPAEMMNLLDYGFYYQKFFPAQAAGGTALLKAVGAPLSSVSFCPTGGINANNASEYLALSNVSCVGGSWIAPVKDIATGNFSAIEKRSHEAMSLSSIVSI